jgi:hypothetical protein
MRDEDYIPASERNHEDVCQHELLDGDEPCNCMRASHAIADDVMRDLAEALRGAQDRVWELSMRVSEEFEACAEADTGADCTELDERGCYGCAARSLYAEVLGEHHAGNAALARYDALTKETR